MKAEELKALQAPLKQKYAAEPQHAMITFKAEAIAGEDIACSIDTGRAIVQAGLHPATGGTGSQACSGDMLLQALAACAGVTLQAVATAMDIVLREARVQVEGDLDFRGTLGVSKTAPVGFQSIRVHFLLATDATPEQIAKLLQLTERYCVVLQTLAHPPPIKATTAPCSTA